MHKPRALLHPTRASTLTNPRAPSPPPSHTHNTYPTFHSLFASIHGVVFTFVLCSHPVSWAFKARIRAVIIRFKAFLRNIVGYAGPPSEVFYDVD